MLTNLLKNNQSFQSFPAEQQEIYLRLATFFQDNSEHTLHLNPTELTETLNIGNKHLWQQFLNLEPTKQYIRTQQAFQAQIAQRKAFQALEREANEGNVNAAKQINELSGILNQTDSNRIIVLHRIDRSGEDAMRQLQDSKPTTTE